MKKWTFVILLIFITFPNVCLAAIPGAAKARMATLSGQMLNETGQPLQGGIVSFFNTEKGIPPLYGNMHRIPDMVSRMGPDGKFTVKLLPGSYYIGALVITDPNRGPGPPKEGEKFYFAKDEQGSLFEIALKAKEVQDGAKITVALPESFPKAKQTVTISGRLLYEDGKPFVGGVVLVKTDMNKARPDFVSARTNEAGLFILQLPPDTPYYLLGRERSVGRPIPGSYIGTYGSKTAIAQGGAIPIGNLRPSQPISGMPQVEGKDIGPSKDLPKTITGKAGENITGIDITMFRMPVPGEQREKLQGTLGFGKKIKEQSPGKNNQMEADQPQK